MTDAQDLTRHFRFPRITAPLCPGQCQRVRAHIAAHLADMLRVDGLASVCSLSPAYFRRAFSMTFGVTPAAYVRNARVEHAATLLTSTDMPLRDVAVESGFFDQAHLSNVFQRIHGDTPNVWRERHREPGSRMPLRPSGPPRPGRITGAPRTVRDAACREGCPAPCWRLNG